MLQLGVLGLLHVRALAVCAAVVACAAPRPADDGSACTSPGETEAVAYANIPASGYDRETLAGELQTMRTQVPASTAPRSRATEEALAMAVKSQENEKWLDAARGFLGVALDDTADKTSRQLAEYYLAVDFHRLHLFTEAHALFADMVATADHVKHDSAIVWLDKTYCAR